MNNGRFGSALVSSNGNGYHKTEELSARDKKLLHSSNGSMVDDNNIKNGNMNCITEWRSTPCELLSLKQKGLNFDFSNSTSIPINFQEAWSFFINSDMSDFKKGFGDPPLVSLKQRLIRFVTYQSLNMPLQAEKELILSVANCPMNNDISVHQRILQSIYVFMTKNSCCPRYGNHWELCGFQGQDPASDFRGVGMFGALQLLYLSSSQETKDSLAPDIYELSHHPHQQFPLAVLSLNVTRMTLDALRHGILNKFCNDKKDVVTTVNQFYLAVMYRIYKKWKENNLTIHDSCFLLKSVEKWCRAHPQKTFSRLNEYLDQNRNLQLGSLETFENKSSRKVWQIAKGEKVKKRDEEEEDLSWLDLTKPSLEVFI